MIIYINIHMIIFIFITTNVNFSAFYDDTN